MTRSEIEAIASSVARRLQPHSGFRGDRDEIDVIVSALARRLSSAATPRSKDYERASDATRHKGFASQISARMASRISARLASAVTKRLDERLGKHVASAVAHRLGEEQLGRVASQVASKIASGRTRTTKETSELPAEDLALGAETETSRSKKR